MHKVIEEALKVAQSAELYIRELTTTSVSMRLGEIKEVAGDKKYEIALRLVKEGRMGTSVSTHVDDESLIERALISLENQNTPSTEFVKHPTCDFDPALSVASQVKAMTTEALVQYVHDLGDRLKSLGEDIPTGIHATKTLKRITLINSAGFEQSFEQTQLNVGLSTLTPQGFQGASIEFAGAGMPQIEDSHLQNLLDQHRLADQPVVLGNEKLPVVFAGRAMGSLLMRVLGGVNGGNVLKGVSPLAGKLGQQLFSRAITIYDDGHYPLGINTRPFDDEGVPTQRTCLYSEGVLKNYLVNGSQVEKFKTNFNLALEPTGNSFKRALFSQEIEDSPAIFETNLIVSGRQLSDDLLLGEIERGLLITGVMGAHTGNINGGEFSLNISSGYLIEQGKLMGKVKGSMIAGNIYEFFKGIDAVGTSLEPMRSIFYHMGYSPMVRFKSASIIGK